MMANINQTILVTGAAGFLGSHLSEKLLEKGHRVIGIDNLSSGSSKNLENVINQENFRFIEHDITDYTDISAIKFTTQFALLLRSISK